MNSTRSTLILPGFSQWKLTSLSSYIGSLFSIKGPRDTTPLLDIERALNKMEKVALTRRQQGRPPMILIMNSTHFVRDDDDGQDLLEMLQQRAEHWATSGLVTTGKLHVQSYACY